jgi:two-component system, LytTR family, response regulator
MKINCIAVDDEPPALGQMEDYILRVPFLNLVASFDNAFDTLQFLKTNTVDLIFLDIEMEGLNGIQLLNVLKIRPKVVLTTAYDQYALKAFDLDVSDYLLKPIPFERFLQAVEKVFDSIKPIAATVTTTPSAVTSTESDARTYMFVKTEYRMQRIDFKDILYIEGLKEYLIIYTPTEKILTLQSFKRIEEMLPASNFVRVHKSFIVALNKIESIERNRIKIGEKLIPIGESYSKYFHTMLVERKLL